MVDIPDTLWNRPWHIRRHLPIPVVNCFEDGTVDFSVINAPVGLALARERKCSLCGYPIKGNIAFIGGSRAAEVGTFSDPPMHEACARASLQICPHIAIGRAKRAKESPQKDYITPEGWIEEKPEEWVLYLTDEYKIEILGEEGERYVIYRSVGSVAQERYVYDEEGGLIRG